MIAGYLTPKANRWARTCQISRTFSSKEATVTRTRTVIAVAYLALTLLVAVTGSAQGPPADPATSETAPPPAAPIPALDIIPRTEQDEATLREVEAKLLADTTVSGIRATLSGAASSRTGKSPGEEPPVRQEECVPVTTKALRPGLGQMSLIMPTPRAGVVSVAELTDNPSPFAEPAYFSHAVQAGSTPPQPPEASAEELAKKLANPVASLISVSFQHDFDFNMGPNDNGFSYTMDFQPVIPFSLNKDWNLISWATVPFIYQDDVVGTGSQTGLGGVQQSLFFSPVKTEPFIWGAGPAVLIPTATDELLGNEKLGLGPTAAILKQSGPWTYGALWYHIWSVAGDDARADVNSTFLQPFLSYTTRTAWTFGVDTESTYDWEGKQWSVPIIPQVSKVLRFGKLPVSLTGGLKCWATAPSGGPEGCGFRFATTFLFPR